LLAITSAVCCLAAVIAAVAQRSDEELVVLLLWIWFLHAVIAGALTAPAVWLSRQRVGWHSWELLAFVLPFALWARLMMSDLSTGKSLANLGEPFYFSFAISAAALIRVGLGQRGNNLIWACALLLGLCGVAVAVFFLVPPLPE
jgi:hypothetical protein